MPADSKYRSPCHPFCEWMQSTFINWWSCGSLKAENLSVYPHCMYQSLPAGHTYICLLYSVCWLEAVEWLINHNHCLRLALFKSVTDKITNCCFQYILKLFFLLKVTIKFEMLYRFCYVLFVVWAEVAYLVVWGCALYRKAYMCLNTCFKEEKFLLMKMISTYNLLDLDILRYLRVLREN